MRLPVFFLLASSAILPAHAQSGSQTGLALPGLGFAYDAGLHAIRPILGIPGASTIGDPLDPGVSAGLSAISPRQNFALLIGADDAIVRMLSLESGDLHTSILSGAMAGPQQIIFSPSGGTAGLYQQNPAKLQIFTHLPQEPVLAHEIDTTAMAGETLSSAISDDGELVLILTGQALWLSRAGGMPVQLPAPDSISAFNFERGGYHAALATRDGHLYLLQDLATGPNFRILAPSDDRTSDPVAVQFSPDGTRVFLAARQGTVAGFGIQTEWSAFISCGCKPSGLSPLDSRTLIRLNEIADGPLMLLDTAGPDLQVWFVPAVIPISGSERGAQ
jgi:hypothetical protein